ncbi:MAG: hypothetical protein KGI38_11345 [Thaumarchaeota archaeon]|nr:hypothetical protein [Nitrososphaerota archaeon]
MTKKDKENEEIVKETAGFAPTEDEFEEDALEQQAMDEAEGAGEDEEE